MNEREIYVILINGWPYTKDRAIRTYMTRERAEKEAKALKRYAWRSDQRIETARFVTVDNEEVNVECYQTSQLPDTCAAVKTQ